MKIQGKLIAAFVFFAQFLLVSNASAQQVSAEFIGETKIRVINNSGYKIYILKKNSKKVDSESYLDNCLFSYQIEESDNLTDDIVIEKSNKKGKDCNVIKKKNMTLVWYYKDEVKHTIGRGGEIFVSVPENTTSNIIEKTKDDPSVNLKIDSGISKQDQEQLLSVNNLDINKAKEKENEKENEQKVNNPISPKVNDDKTINPPIVAKPDIKDNKGGVKIEPKITVTNDKNDKIDLTKILEDYETKYKNISSKSDSLLAKRELFSDADCKKREALVEDSKLLLKKIEQEKNAEAKKKLKEVVEKIRKIIEEITKIPGCGRGPIDFEKMEKLYNEAVFISQNAVIKELQSKIAFVSQKLKSDNFFNWIKKDSLLLQIKEIDDLIQSSKNNFNDTYTQFFENYNLPSDFDNMVLTKQGSINDNYEALEYDIRDLKEKTEHLKPSYVILIVIAIALILLLSALIFYVKAYFKKKALVKYEATRDHGVMVIDDEEEIMRSYTPGLEKVKETVGKYYYAVNMNALFSDTAIQTVYINRKCVRDIYQFFSGSLKKSGKVDETGCFVVGRWEYASSINKDAYNISLEEIIEPGSDAVYGEFALDFGEQIGISLESRIIDLRRNTGDEYVHTAWIHSHPGLGLFLSAHDLIVQSQLLYGEHPNRLLAIVIDNNTENLSMALFSPKKDGSMNNKENMKKRLFLEDLYQWARRPLSTIAPSFSDYFKYIVEDSDSCIKDILFSDTAIINMDHAIEIDASGLIGYFYGKPFDVASRQYSMVIEKFLPIHADETKDTKNDAIGCLLVESKFSYLQILNKYEPIIDRYDFFVVYLPELDALNIIVKISDNNFPDSEEKIMPIQLLEMKKWTRRVR